MQLKNSLANISLASKLFVSFGVIVFMLLLSSLVVQGVVVSLPISAVAVMRLSLFLQSSITFVASSLLLAYLLFDEQPMQFLSLTRVPSGMPLLLVFLSMVAVIPTINFLSEWNDGMKFPARFSELEMWMRSVEESSRQFSSLLLDTKNMVAFLLNIFVLAVMAGLGEELFFRGIFQKLLQNNMRITLFSVWISAFVFSAIHFQFYGFVPRLLLGALLGYLYLWSGNLWLAIFAHLLNNAFVVIFAYAIQFFPHLEWIETIGTGASGIYFAIGSLIVTSTLLYWLRRYYRNDA